MRTKCPHCGGDDEVLCSSDADGWLATNHPACSRRYYWHYATGETAKERPAEHAPVQVRLIGDMVRLQPQQGDVLILMCDHIIDDDTARSLRRAIESHIPNVKCLVLGDGMRLGLLGRFEESTTPAIDPESIAAQLVRGQKS